MIGSPCKTDKMIILNLVENFMFFTFKTFTIFFYQNYIFTTRMVVHGQLVEPAVCLRDLYDVFLLDIVRIQGKLSGP